MKNAKKALAKNILREIKQSRGRFLSIFGIVAIGVGFFGGIKAASPDMRMTANIYFDRTNMMDYRIVSTYGFEEADVEALSEIGTVYPSYFVDAFLSRPENGEAHKEVRLLSLNDYGKDNDYNNVTLTAGRFPENADECISNYGDLIGGINVGEKIIITAPNSSEDGIIAAEKEYTVVGTFTSPMYIDKSNIGITTIGSGSLSGIFYVPQENFDSDYYTELYITNADLAALECYSDEYENKADNIELQIETLGESCAERRYNDILEEANAEIADAEQELATAEAEANEKLADGKKELDEALTEIEDGKQKLSDGKQELAEAKITLEDSRKQLDDGKITLENSKAEYYIQISNAQTELDNAKAELDSGFKEYKENLANYNDGEIQYRDGLSQYESGYQQYTEGLAQIEPQKAALEEAKLTLNETAAQLEIMAAAYGTDNPQYIAAKEQYDSGVAEYESGAAQLAEAEATLSSTGEQLAAAKAKLDETRITLDNAKTQLDEGFKQYNEGLRQYNDGVNALETARTDGWNQILEAQQTLSDGEIEYAEGLAEYQQAVLDLEKAEQDLIDGEAEYNNGLAEYEEKKLEAETEIADARAEIDEAKTKIDDLERPVWYVFNRTNNSGYTEYRENSERINNIAAVFPIFFIVVAGLVCLTTMTRMVEEQRTQIGTFKALGYGNGDIIFKYMFYALVATVSGAIFGLVAGFKIFPFVIIYAYGLLYDLPEMYIPFDWSLAAYTVLFCIAAIFVTVYLACKNELSEAPSQLMRPKPPKSGRRVLLERITSIWSKLSFSNKVTIRNIFRYKKRMLMTVIGIAGCTALTLTGFGLKDGISEVVQKQYNEVMLYNGVVVFEEDADSDEILRQCNETAFENIATTALIYQKQFTANANNLNCDANIVVPENADKYTQFMSLQDRISGEKFAIDDSGVIIDEKMSILLGDVKKGDTITVLKSDTEKVNLTISAVTENYAGHYIYMSQQLFSDAFGDPLAYNMIQFHYNDPSSISENDENQLANKLMNIDDVLAVSFSSGTSESFYTMLDTLNMVIIVIIIAAGLLAFIVLYNLTNININERIREISTLKVLGFYDKEVDNYIFRENFLLTILGAGLGLFLGIFLTNFVVRTAEVDLVMFGRDIMPLSFLYAFLITIAFATLVSIFMHRHLIRINMIEALKSVE